MSTCSANTSPSHVSEDIPASSPWELLDLNDCLNDSPQYRHVLEAKEKELLDLERKLHKVVQSCTKVVDSGHLHMNNMSVFGQSIKDLSFHFHEQQPVIAEALMKQCDVINEIQSYYSILFDQVQRTVTRGINSFLMGELKKAHDSKKSFDRISEELNSVIHKNASISRQKPYEADELSTMLQTTLVEFSHQALDYTYQINVISCCKGHHLVTNMLSFMRSLSTFYHQGNEAMKQIDPYIKDLTLKMDQYKLQSSTDIEMMADRHALVSVQHLENDREQPLAVLDNPSQSIELSGYLFKRASNAFKLWNRYFELRDNKLLYLKKDSDMDYSVVADDLRICTVKLADDLERRFCFEVVTPMRSCMLQADSEAQRKKWCHYLEAGIAKALRVTNSNRTREARDRRRLTSTGTTFQHSVTDSLSPRMESPLLLARSETPSSLNSFSSSVGQDFLETPGNEKCADCSSPYPKWASINLGILLCIECSGLHRSLGVHISKVRSLTLDDWDSEHQKIMSLLGNFRVNGILEYEIPEHVKKPNPNSSVPDKESYIRNKYVSHAFVHPHPDFNRPEIPVPPRKIQGTLLRAAAASPKLAGRLDRPLAMSIGYENTVSSPQPSSPAVPVALSVPIEERVPKDKWAMLEANLKKLEKTGKLQQWNLSRRLNSAVRRAPSPKKHFSLSRFTRPSSFRRKKSPLIPDDLPLSDNEIEAHRTSLMSPSPIISNGERPPKPPRTYTTTMADVDFMLGHTSLFSADDECSFSSELMDTFQKLGSVYSINTMISNDAVTNSQLDISVSSNVVPISPLAPHVPIMRSISAMDTIDTPIANQQTTNTLPAIAISCNRHNDSDIIEEEPPRLIHRELSYSDTSLNRTLVPPASFSGVVKNQIGEGNSERSASLSSLDSYQSAEDYETSYVVRFRKHDMSDGPRPDSVASECFHTPPRSPDLDESQMALMQNQMTSMGLSLGMDIILDDTPSSNGSTHMRESSLATLVLIDNEDDDEGTTSYMTRSAIHKHSLLSPDGSARQLEIVPAENKVETSLDTSPSSSTIQTELSSSAGINIEDKIIEGQELITEGEPLVDEELIDEYEPVIIPDQMSPTKYIFECSLSGDIPGILCGIVHGGLVSEQDGDEGNRYPIHQACIAGNETVVEYLYQNGAKVNVSDERGVTPLHLAAMNDDTSLVASLLKHGADYKCTDSSNKTPLAYALEKQNGDIVTLLKLAKASAEAEVAEDRGASQRLMDETMVGVYKDYSVGSSPDPERLTKRRSISSSNSTPSYGSGHSVEEVKEVREGTKMIVISSSSVAVNNNNNCNHRQNDEK